MTRRALLLLFPFVLALLVRPGQRVDAQAPILLKVATTAPAGSPEAALMHALGAEAEKVSTGQIEARLFTHGALGDGPALVERARAGTLQAVVVPLEALAATWQPADVLLSPYLFRNDAQADRRLDGPVRRTLARELLNHDLVFGSWGPSELRGWASAGDPLSSPDRAHGLKHARGGSSAADATARALGMEVLDLPLSKAGTLARGPLQIVAATPRELFGAELTHAVRSYTRSDHALSASVLLLSKQWFDGLPEDPKRGLGTLPGALAKDARKAQRALRARLLETLEQRGVAIHEPTARERKSLARATRDVAGMLARETGSAGARLLRAARGD